MGANEIGGLADLVAAIATIITLAFVAVELRANRQQNRLSLLKTLDDGWNVINAQIAQNESLAAILNKGGPDPDTLTDTEATQFFFLVTQYINNHKSVWTLLDAEGLDTHHELWIKYDISAFYGMPGVWRVFLSMKELMPEKFITFVEAQRKIRLDLAVGNWREFDE